MTDTLNIDSAITENEKARFDLLVAGLFTENVSLLRCTLDDRATTVLVAERTYADGSVELLPLFVAVDDELMDRIVPAEGINVVSDDEG